MGTVAPMPSGIPDPPRTLGKEGQRLWESIWGLRKAWISQQIDVEHVALLCESMDERQMLRLRALRGDDWRDRVALRNLDEQIRILMSALGLNPTDRKALSTGGTGDPNSRLAALRAGVARPSTN
jgi:hypothetical protein